MPLHQPTCFSSFCQLINMRLFIVDLAKFKVVGCKTITIFMLDFNFVFLYFRFHFFHYPVPFTLNMDPFSYLKIEVGVFNKLMNLISRVEYLLKHCLVSETIKSSISCIFFGSNVGSFVVHFQVESNLFCISFFRDHAFICNVIR